MVRWLAILALVGLLLAGCGGAAPEPTPEPSPTAPPPTATTVPAPSPTTAPAQPSPTPAGQPETVWVGNTDGEGVYLRHSPSMADRVRAYPDGTQLTIIGDDVVGDGQQWHHVRAPDGLEGYVPTAYTTDSPPS